MTVAYPGIPRLGYGQSYYTLRSIFMDRVPPPEVHIHIRLFDVATYVPIGDLSSTNPRKTPSNGHVNGAPNEYNSKSAEAVEVDVPEDERLQFDDWLRNLWREKDSKIEEFLGKGYFGSAAPEFDIPLQVRSMVEVLDAFCFCVPGLALYTWSRLTGKW